MADASGPIQLTSADFSHGGSIPRTHSCEGENLSPALAWEAVPVERRSLAVVCDDPDAPRGTWVHWVLYNLPGETVELSRGVPALPELPSGARQGRNDSGEIGYSGPCPPRASRIGITSASMLWTSCSPFPTGSPGPSWRLPCPITSWLREH